MHKEIKLYKKIIYNHSKENPMLKYILQKKKKKNKYWFWKLKKKNTLMKEIKEGLNKYEDIPYP